MKMRFKYLFLIVALFILPLALGEVNKQYQLDLHYSYGELELKNLAKLKIYFDFYVILAFPFLSISIFTLLYDNGYSQAKGVSL